MTEKTLKDTAARKSISSRLEQNFLVEAGAGSGKTTCLVERMAALLAGGFCPPEKMAAVTFTRKAAGELKEKYQLRLEDMFRQEKVPALRKRLEEALGKMEQIFVGTIHSFCARLLRERPVEAGVAPDFEEVEGVEERLLEERAWEEYLLEVRFQRPELLQQLGELDLSPEDVKGAFKELNRYPEVQMVSSPVPYPDFSGVRERLADFCRLAGTLLPSEPHPKGWDALQRTAGLALRWRRMFDLTEDRYLLRLLEKMDKNAGPTYERWPVREQAEELAAAFNTFREQDLQPARKAWLEYRHYHLLNFLLPAVGRYEELRRRENKLNYQDLLLLTAKLLRHNPEVRGYFQDKYTHLLVDEFQDTDPLQAEVMLYLTGTELIETDWTRLSPRSGSLFVVGDPKQSIYRFRRADMDTYNRVKKIITASGGEVLHLTSNFRSLPRLIHWTNRAFNDLFAPFSPPYQADFVQMDPVRQRKQDADEGLLMAPVGDVQKNNQEQIASQDASQIAGWISRSLQGGLKLSRTAEDKACGLGDNPLPGDFLVLVHYKRHMSLYARALEALGVPFTLSGGGDISESIELQELLCLLQALADPHNPVTLVASLRGLFFGISDDCLYRFQKAGGQFSFLSDIPREAEQLVQDTFTPAWEILRRFWRWSRELPPSSAVQKIISELGLLPLALAGELGRGRAGYTLQALELLRQREKQGETGFARAVDYLERLIEEGLEEELDIEGGGFPAVRIMNLHKAKGLEAPVVILANPGRHLAHEPHLHVTREAEQARGYLVIQKEGNFGAQALALPPQWDHYREEELSYQEAEEVRLLYVAATRAKDLLLISTYPKKAENSPWYPLEEFLAGPDREELSISRPGPEPETGFGSGPEPALAPFEGCQTPEAEPITVSMLEEAREKIKLAIEELSTPTYARQRAGEARSEQEAPGRHSKGRGATWGRTIHAALETLLKRLPAENTEEKLRALAGELLRREGQPPEKNEEVFLALTEFLSTSFWQRVSAAPERYAEIPFGLWEEDAYITGTVDLAFREGDGWVLVDYKTDVVEDADHLQALLEYYTPQVELYRRSWEQVTGEPVAELGLFFTDNLSYMKIV